MAKRFIPVDRSTGYLLPPSVQDWLLAQHLARCVVEIVDQLDLSRLEARYGGRGDSSTLGAVGLAGLRLCQRRVFEPRDRALDL